MSGWRHVVSKSTHADAPRPPTHQHITAAHKILLWPAVINTLSDLRIPQTEEIQAFLSKRTAWLLELEARKRAEITTALPDHTMQASTPARPGEGSKIPSMADFVPHFPEVFPNFNEAKLHAWSRAYFESYNSLVPVLDDVIYYRETLPHVLDNGFSHGDHHTLLVLGVVALGTVAEEGAKGDPINNMVRQSGLRGGSLAQSPGREAFGAFQKRIGYVITDNTIESVQVLLLQAYVPTHDHDEWQSLTFALRMYYEANARHVVFRSSD